MNLDTLATVQQAAIRLLARREHSSTELQQKLRQKGATPELITAVSQQLQQQNILSDTRFTEAYVRMRANRGYGPIRIRAELIQRGINEDLYEQTLTELDFDWADLAEQARRKKFGGSFPKEFMQRAPQLKFLQYRGFLTSDF